VEWEATSGSVAVRTEKQEYLAARLVVAAGAWADRLLGGINLSLNVIRKPAFWFPIKGSAAGWPVFYHEESGGLDGTSMKVAEHSGGEPVQNPTKLPREQRATEHAEVAGFVAKSLVGVEPLASNHSVCMYTMSNDGHFVVDQHPGHANVTIAAGFSGHGFKFTPVIGRAIADLATDGDSDLPIEFLRLDRGQIS
jgi:sarcosine oxidase